MSVLWAPAATSWLMATILDTLGAYTLTRLHTSKAPQHNGALGLIAPKTCLPPLYKLAVSLPVRSIPVSYWPTRGKNQRYISFQNLQSAQPRFPFLVVSLMSHARRTSSCRANCDGARKGVNSDIRSLPTAIYHRHFVHRV
ncbi:hypothetical protein BDR22DRAFT_255567 [Usnea florida]